MALALTGILTLFPTPMSGFQSLERVVAGIVEKALARLQHVAALRAFRAETEVLGAERLPKAGNAGFGTVGIAALGEQRGAETRGVRLQPRSYGAVKADPRTVFAIEGSLGSEEVGEKIGRVALADREQEVPVA